MYPFNIRVYGILLDKKKNVLVCDEVIHRRHITKFPGGGLEFGEGTIDCIKREFLEETELKIKILKHFYTTDFFQASAFNSKSQVISIYYLVEVHSAKKDIHVFPPLGQGQEGAQIVSFRWIPLKKISPKDFTFPIDKKVAGMLRGLR